MDPDGDMILILTMNLLSADHLLAVESLGQGSKTGVEDTSTKTKHQVEGRLLLDVIVGKCSAVLKLLACEDQSLLIRGDTLFILNLLFDIVDRVGGLDLKGDSFARKGLHEDLRIRNEFKDKSQCDGQLKDGTSD